MTYKKITTPTWDNAKNIPKCPDKGAFEVGYYGATYFLVNGKFHRKNGPAIIWSDGTKKYLQNNLLHRVDGPAIIQADGTEWYYQDGKIHREDGPALIVNGSYEYYYLFNQEYSKEEWEPLAIQLSLKEQIL